MITENRMNFESSTLLEQLLWRAQHQPDKRIYTFLIDGEKEEVGLTYKELDKQSRAIGAKLQSLGKIGDRVLLLYQPGLEFITAYWGCFYSGIIAVPVYPPNPYQLKQAVSRFDAIVNDVDPLLALTTSSNINKAELLFSQVSKIKTIHCLATDEVDEKLAEQWQNPEINSNSLAFFQYTSGSTTTPRGVMVSHGNLMYNLSLIKKYFEHTSNSQGVIWLPPYHDMGLIGGILQPVYSGFPVTLMSPVSFLQHPFRWLKAITNFKATTSGGPNFAYDLCIRKITPGQRETLDLSSWDVAFNGAEPINHKILKQFAEYFKPCGFRREAFYPCYGLAEATLFVSGGLKSAPPVVRNFQLAALEQNKVIINDVKDEPGRTLVSCGQNLAGQEIVIVNPESLTLCPPDEIGEIWVSGHSVAQGYWNKDSESKYTFKAYVANTKQGPFLRTGDLGFIKDGELFITGRLKDLIIIDGKNHYPVDIEQTLENSHKSLKAGGCVSFSVNNNGQEHLVVVAEVDRRHKLQCSQLNKKTTSENKSVQTMVLNVNDVKRSIRKAISENHDLRVYDIVLIKAGRIPKTSSGKIQRHICKAQYLSGTLDVLGE